MISLGLKSTLARTLAVFSVITLCSTSFARIELKPAKQHTAGQNTTEQTAEATKVADASFSGYQIVGTIVAAGVSIAMIFGLAKKCAARADDAANGGGDDGDDDNGGGGNGGGGHLFQQLDRQHGVDNAGGGNDNGGHLFQPFNNPANDVGNVGGNDNGGGGNDNAGIGGGGANGVVVKKRTGIRRSEIDFLISTSPNKK